jgi:hypothetical protein
VVRILRQKGFLEEKELTKLSLLPQKNLRVILSLLITEGILQTQDLPQSVKGAHSSGPMYGLHARTLLSLFQQNVAKTLLNLLIK